MGCLKDFKSPVSSVEATGVHSLTLHRDRPERDEKIRKFFLGR